MLFYHLLKVYFVYDQHNHHSLKMSFTEAFFVCVCACVDSKGLEIRKLAGQPQVEGWQFIVGNIKS